MTDIEPIHANSTDGGEVYRLLGMVHFMAGALANSPGKQFTLARTNSDPQYGPIVTAWTNGIVDIEARTWREQKPAYHEYSLTQVAKEEE